jgi:hypothetical protein
MAGVFTRCRLLGPLVLLVLATWPGAAEAAPYTLRPAAVISNNWTVTPSSSTAASVLADVVSQPTAPGTATDYLSSQAGSAVAEVTVQSTPLEAGDSVVSAQGWAYLASGSKRTVQLELVSLGASLGSTTVPAGQAAGWQSVTVNQALTQAQLNDLRIRITLSGSGASTTSIVYAAYVALTTSDPAVLSTSSSTSPSFSATLSAADQTIPYTLPLTVSDRRGTAAGWNLSLTSTTFSTGGGSPHTLPTTASQVTGVGQACAGATCTSPVNSVGYPVALPAGSPAPTGAKVYNAAAGSGTGIFTVTSTVGVTVPGNSYAGSYTSTLTFAVASGP